MAILANGALIVRAGLVHSLALMTAAGIVAVLTGSALWILSATHYSALAGRRVGHLFARGRQAVVSLAVFVTVFSAIALVATLIR